MKYLGLLGWGLMLAAASMPAAAAPVDSGGNPGSLMRVPASQPGPRREADSPAPQRGADDTGRSRMSADERRQLRRDIQNAGRAIYRSAAQGRGGGQRPGRR